MPAIYDRSSAPDQSIGARSAAVREGSAWQDETKAEDVEGDAALAADSFEARRKVMSNHRMEACQWLATQDPLGWLVVMRQVFGPLGTVMSAFLKAAGPCWEAYEAARQLSPDGERPERTYRVTMAFEGALNEPSLEQMQELRSDPSAWEVPPHRFRTCSLRTSAAMMLSIGACTLFEMQAVHRRYPFKLFGLLTGGAGASQALAAEIMADKE